MEGIEDVLGLLGVRDTLDGAHVSCVVLATAAEGWWYMVQKAGRRLTLAVATG